MTRRTQNNIKKGFVAILMLCSCVPVLAQKVTINSDSLWCDHLSEIIKCASTDIISDRISHINDSDTIAPLLPALTLTDSKQETISKQYGKVTYTAICYTSAKPDQILITKYERWYTKVKKCLDLWQVARLDNEDKSLPEYKDYFITNDEDETTVRLDIIKTTKGYSVRLRIF